MKYFDEQLHKQAQKVRLKAAERRELRERILTYMEYHPLPKQGATTDTLHSQPFITVAFNTVYTRVAAGFLTLMVIVGLPIAAERSVPGDVLYPIKTEFNEGVRAQFANTPYEKVVFETSQIERRIAEARLLAKEGKLTEEVEAEIAQTVKGHSDAAQEGIVALKTENNDEGTIAEITFASALDIQTAVLETEAARESTTTPQTRGIADVVKAEQAEVAAEQSKNGPSYQGLMARVETETTRAYELFESINGAATDEERVQIERRLADIDRSVTGARGMHASGADGAVDALKKALSQTQKLVVFMTDIDVRENVELESIVPVVLTDEEHAAEIQSRLEVSAARFEAVQKAVAANEDTDSSEKIALAMSEVTDLFGTATTALEIRQYEVAGDALDEIDAYLKDIEGLLAPTADSPPGEEVGEDKNPPAAPTEEEVETESTESEELETDSTEPAASVQEPTITEAAVTQPQ